MSTLQIEWFLLGQQDCAEGKPHIAGLPERYNIGYAAQYEIKQAITEKTKEKDNAS